MPSWLDSCFCEKAAHRHHGASIDLLLWMGTMKHRTDTMEGNPHSRSASLADFRAACTPQTLDISPGDVRSNRILENGV
jgi:hypothetical protein